MNDAAIKNIIKWYSQDKLNLKTIGLKLNVSGEYIRRILARNNVDRRIHFYKTEITPEQELEIVSKYKAKEKVQDIHKKYGLCEKRFYDILKKHNVKLGVHLLSSIPKEKQVKICNDYKSGLSLGDLVLKYKSNKTSLLKILRSNKESVRKPDVARKNFQTNRNLFEKINSPKKAYVFGMLLSDGCNHGGKIHLWLQNKDSYMLNIIMKEFYQEGCSKIYNRAKMGSDCSGFVISDRKIANDLKNLGMIEKKSLTLKYPQGIIPDKLFGHFLRGYFDGDGCIYLNKKKKVKTFIITSGSIAFLQSLKEEIEKRVKENIPNVFSHKGGWYEIRSSKTTVIKSLYNLMYSKNIGVFYLTRKKEKFLDAVMMNKK
jgi:Mor family transcriptional regulator